MIWLRPVRLSAHGLGPPGTWPRLGLDRGPGTAPGEDRHPAPRGDGGLVQGDVITAINDEAIEDADDMLNALEKLNPGDSATLTLWRAGATRRVTVVLSESEE